MGLRQDRLADEIRDIVGSLFAGGQLSDPRLEGVVITAVKLTGDLQLATIYFRSYDERFTSADIIKGLTSASGVMKRKLSEVLDVRRIPELRFLFDESIERGSRIEELLKKI